MREKQKAREDILKVLQWQRLDENKMKKILLAVIIALSPTLASAYVFPSDAISIHYEQLANGKQIMLATSTARTILFIGIDFDGTQASAGIWCSDVAEQVDTVNDILETHLKPATEEYFMSYHCNGKPITTSVQSSSGSWGHFFVTYVDRDTRVTPDPLALTPQPVTGATTTIGAYSTYGGATFQEALFISCVIIFFLAILAWPTFFRMFRRQDPI